MPESLSFPGPVRDSVATWETSSSSSIYPKSLTSAEKSSFIDLGESDLSGSYPTTAEQFNADDVSYRLKLLVNNNYYLPPAHNKPVVSSLSPPTPAKPVKPTSPRFFEFFKKSKTTPSTPQTEVPVINIGGPLLRTTADTSSLGLGLPLSHGLIPPVGSPGRTSAERVPAVMVVRERLPNLDSAVIDAQRGLRAPNVTRLRAKSDTARPLAVDVDPTDAVDSPSSFAGLHAGLGAFEAPDASQLAEHIPPPQSPSVPSSTPEPWRRALLQQVVTHSLTSTPTGTPDHSRLGTPVSSSRSKSHDIPRPMPRKQVQPPLVVNKALPGGRIIDPKLFDREASPTSVSTGRRPRTAPNSKPHPKIRKEMHLTLPFHPLPDRPETPSVLVPLTPAPRKSPHKQGTFQWNSAPVEVSSFQRKISASPQSQGGMRRSMSSPMLHDSYERSASLSAVRPTSPSSARLPHAEKLALLAEEVTTGVMPPISAPPDSKTSEHAHAQHSFSSQPSPASKHEFGLLPESASSHRVSFDARCPSPFAQRSFGMAAADRVSRISHGSGSVSGSVRQQPLSPRSVVLSPEGELSPAPRQPSPISSIVLAPPPRGRRDAPVASPRDPSASPRPPSTPDTASSHSVAPARTSLPRIQIPSPSTPTFGMYSMHPQKPEARSATYPDSGARARSPSVRSAATDAMSAISFFDTFQDQHRILDVDMESSDEEDDYDGLASIHTSSRARSGSQARSTGSCPSPSRPSRTYYPLASLAGQSTSSLHSTRSTFRNVGIENSPARGTFFTDRKREGSSTLQLYKFGRGSQSSLAVSTASLGVGRASADDMITSPITPTSRSPIEIESEGDEEASPAAASEEVQKLDGLLLQHMEAERKQIRRITKDRRSARS
jgi:hypothetical protein